MTDSLVRSAGYLLPGAPGVSLSYALSAIGYQLIAFEEWGTKGVEEDIPLISIHASDILRLYLKRT
jgi:hypothetical protein